MGPSFAPNPPPRSTVAPFARLPVFEGEAGDDAAEDEILSVFLPPSRGLFLTLALDVGARESCPRSLLLLVAATLAGSGRDHFSEHSTIYILNASTVEGRWTIASWRRCFDAATAGLM